MGLMPYTVGTVGTGLPVVCVCACACACACACVCVGVRACVHALMDACVDDSTCWWCCGCAAAGVLVQACVVAPGCVVQSHVAPLPSPSTSHTS
jgi:hypothetical protein